MEIVHLWYVYSNVFALIIEDFVVCSMITAGCCKKVSLSGCLHRRLKFALYL